jgi:hypothetical protein
MQEAHGAIQHELLLRAEEDREYLTQPLLCALLGLPDSKVISLTFLLSTIFFQKPLKCQHANHT